MAVSQLSAELLRLRFRSRLRVERLEDRYVPGETLTGLLFMPAALSPLQAAWLEERDTAADDTASLAVADDSANQMDMAALGRLASADGTGEQELVTFLSSLTSELRDAGGSGARSADPWDTVATSLGTDRSGGATDLAPFFAGVPSQASGSSSAASDAGAPTFTAAAPALAPAKASPITSGPAAVDGAPSGDGGAMPLLTLKPNATSAPTGYSPAQMRHAYGFDQLAQTGAGQTIYIVDAYDDPTIAADLHTFDVQFGLPDPAFTKVTPQGNPRTDSGWALEIALDVEWAHAIAPQANITLVEAKTNSTSNLYGAVDWAVNNGAHIVSMSWGAGESSGEPSLDSHFNRPGVAFFVSSGDTGGVVEYPSASPYVVSVGGTRLPLDSAGNLSGAESAWGSGGGGASAVETEPAYQANYQITLTGGKRGTPDVAYDADPNTGVSVYDSTRYQGQAGWFQVGGTSAAAPQWAALAALADQGRATPLSSSSLTSRFDYNAATTNGTPGGTTYAQNYRDVTSGSNGHPALTGYDLATGVGSPLAASLVPWLIANG